jgi:hypothetical protein
MRPIDICIRILCCRSHYPSACTTSFGHTFTQRPFLRNKPPLPNLFHQLSHGILQHKIHGQRKSRFTPPKRNVNFIQYTTHHHNLRGDVRGVDCSGTVFDAAEVGLHRETVAKDAGEGREFNDTVSKDDAVGLGAEEDYTVGV